MCIEWRYGRRRGCSPHQKWSQHLVFRSPAKIWNTLSFPFIRLKLERGAIRTWYCQLQWVGISADLYTCKWEPLGDQFYATRGGFRCRRLSDVSGNWFSYDLTIESKYPSVKFVLWKWNEILVTNNRVKWMIWK